MATSYKPEEMRLYWRLHSRQWKDLDRELDPEGLTNVCFNGAPLWLNRFASACQRRTFLSLLTGAGDLRGRKVLDVGCGVGRWSRLLTTLGAHVTGIDLQPETLRDDKARLPACRFVEMGAESLAFRSDAFEFAISVTVLQHVPDEAQLSALREIRRVLVDGGALLLLEGTKDRGGHVFCHSAREWCGMASEVGFRLEREEAYDFAPLIYAVKNAAAFWHRSAGSAEKDLPPVEEYVSRFGRGASRGGVGRKVYRAGLHAATWASYPLERILMRAAPAGWAHHRGMLFRAV